jgi:hypothetical protein
MQTQDLENFFQKNWKELEYTYIQDRESQSFLERGLEFSNQSYKRILRKNTYRMIEMGNIMVRDSLQVIAIF